MNSLVRRGLGLAVLLSLPSLLEAGIPLYGNGSDRTLEFGFKLQMQYYHLGGDGFSEEDLFFRRLRPALEASISRSVQAEAEFDFGKTVEGEEIEFKDLYVSYRGLEAKGFLFRVGNAKPPFSRQFQSSSKSLTLIDRGFVGIDDFGTLDRVLGARVDGRDSSGRFVVGANAGLASHEPDASQMEFESPLNAGEGANRGWSLSGRVELQPLGEVDYDQGDFGSESLRFALAAGAYRWTNDGSTNLYTENGSSTRPDAADLDRSRGLELGAALRGRGLTADSEIHWIRGETRDPSFDGGLYDDGAAELTKISLQSGYMVLPEKVQISGGYDRMNAEPYATAWKRLSLGGTYFFRRNQLKLQLEYILHWGFAGVAGDDPQAVVTQLQIAF